jgi:hypothetical protein
MKCILPFLILNIITAYAAQSPSNNIFLLPVKTHQNSSATFKQDDKNEQACSATKLINIKDKKKETEARNKIILAAFVSSAAIFIIMSQIKKPEELFLKSFYYIAYPFGWFFKRKTNDDKK